MRAAIVCLVNRERQNAGERPLATVASLSEAAQRHTEDMAFGDYFEHIGPRGDTPAQRMRATGYLNGSQSYAVGENIAFGTGWMATPRAIVAGWMASPGHRANILDSSYTDTGIGASAHPPASLSGGQRGAIYTEDFGVTSN
ncbi:MAG TPA: CAP domain-containing protein [Solirubrobacteraceae bacterium]|nr:CAP domain-containing protein [Solirubrobacteraceae bacterium]